MAKTLEQKLCKRSFGYSLLRNLLVRPALYLFYRKIDVIGVKNVPNFGSVIFAPNHQNALMDALAINCTKDRQPVFVARADIFKKPMIIKALHFLRILPIYRKRDAGIVSDNNQETFDLLINVLHNDLAIGIMPEGMHSEIKRLQTLQKGIFRIAMQVQEKYGNTSKVKIIPVGIDYTSTRKFRADVRIKYGKVIELSDFYDLYAENQAKAFKQMQEKLSEKMKEGMIDITNEEYYDVIERLCVIYHKEAIQKLGLDKSNADHRLKAQQNIVSALLGYAKTNPDEMSKLSLEVKKYLEIVQKYNLRDWVIERQPYSLVGLLARSLLAIVGVPFWLLGMLFNYPPYKLSAYASQKVKDPQFITSVQFVTGLVAYPVYYAIMIVLMVCFIPCIWGKTIMPLLMIPLGLFAFRYYISIKKLVARFRFWANKNSELLEAVKLRNVVVEKMRLVVNG